MGGIFIPESIAINGGKKLKPNSVIEISGAKNEVLGAMAAAVLTDRPVTLRNVPNISDVLDMGHLMTDMGADVKYDAISRKMRIHVKKISGNTLPDAAYKFRASYYIWGALMARFAMTGEFGSLKIKTPGGCFSNDRGIDYHLNLMRNVFDARVHETDSGFELVLPRRMRQDEFPIYSTLQVSHGATFHWLLSVATASRAKMMYNASLEPEVAHLVGILNGMGAKIRGSHSTAKQSFGTGTLLSGTDVSILPDRLETASYALLAMGLRDRIPLRGTDVASSRPWLNSVMEIAGHEHVSISDDGKAMNFDFSDLGKFPGQRFLMSPIPGKETDLHQVWAPVLSTAASVSEIYDPVWPTRSGHLPELAKFGMASESSVFDIENSVAKKALKIKIKPSELHAANATGMDLRGTFGLVIAAAMAKGVSNINNPGFALRGYPNLVDNMRKIGVDVKSSQGGTTVRELPKLQRHR